MGTVGIAFGSPTSGQGFNVSSTVSQIVANMQMVEKPWQTQLASLQSQDTALTSIGSDMSTLSSTLESLTTTGGVLSEKEGSSSDESVLTLAGASSGAVAGNYTVQVQSLATTATYDSAAIGANDVLSGSLTINGKAITIAPTNDTLPTLANTINNGQYGVTANVLTTSSGSVLSLVSDSSGAAGNFTLTSSITDSTTGNAVSFTQPQAGADADLTLNGLAITSSSNTVTDAIPGVTIQLLSAAPTTAVQVEITNDDNDVETAVSSLVTAYNKVLGDLATQHSNNTSGNPEPLYGNPVVSMLQGQLEQAINFTQASGSITSLSQLGISMNDNGTLNLNPDTLSGELNSNYQGVVNFFQPGSGFTSFGDNLTSVMNTMGGNAPNGEVYLTLQQDSSQESSLNTSISKENAVISAQQSSLTAELTAANYTLQEIPALIGEVNELYSAITGYNENPNA